MNGFEPSTTSKHVVISDLSTKPSTVKSHIKGMLGTIIRMLARTRTLLFSPRPSTREEEIPLDTLCRLDLEEDLKYLDNGLRGSGDRRNDTRRGSHKRQAAEPAAS